MVSQAKAMQSLMGTLTARFALHSYKLLELYTICSKSLCAIIFGHFIDPRLWTSHWNAADVSKARHTAYLFCTVIISEMVCCVIAVSISAMRSRKKSQKWDTMRKDFWNIWYAHLLSVCTVLVDYNGVTSKSYAIPNGDAHSALCVA